MNVWVLENPGYNLISTVVSSQRQKGALCYLIEQKAKNSLRDRPLKIVIKYSKVYTRLLGFQPSYIYLIPLQTSLVVFKSIKNKEFHVAWM